MRRSGVRALFCILLLGVPTCLVARPQVQVEAATGELSNQVNVSELEVFYEADRLNPGWPYASDGDQSPGTGSWSVDGWRQQIESTTYQVALSEVAAGYRYLSAPQLWFEAHAGLHVIEGESGVKNSTHGVGSLKLHWLNDRWGQWQLRVGREFNAKRILLLAGDPTNVAAQTGEAQWRWQPQERWRISAKFREADLQDENVRRSGEMQVLWGVMLNPHWIWLGVGAEDLQNSRTSANYWSPDRFQAYGLRLDMSLRLNDDWNWLVGGSLNQLRESHQPWGQGHYLKTGLQLGSHEEALMRIYYETSHSRQKISTWESELVGFNVQWPF